MLTQTPDNQYTFFLDRISHLLKLFKHGNVSYDDATLLNVMANWTNPWVRGTPAGYLMYGTQPLILTLTEFTIGNEAMFSYMNVPHRAAIITDTNNAGKKTLSPVDLCPSHVISNRVILSSKDTVHSLLLLPILRLK